MKKNSKASGPSARRLARRSARRAVFAIPSLFAVCASLGLLSACGAAPDHNDRFASETYDEYTETLTNAVIGTPSGIITVGPTGGGGGTSGSAASGSSIGTAGSMASAGSAAAGSVGGGAGVFGGGGVIADGGTVGDGGGMGGGPGGFGFWHFDDCSPTSHFLLDSSGEGANAQHALNASCVPGISGLGVNFRSAKDIVQVPDEPQFTVAERVAVAAWVHPATVSGNQPIVIKRLNNQTSFSLGIHNGSIEMSVVLTTGTTFISRAPIAAGTWTHVAGMYDGTFVFLFINGQQFGQIFAGGTLRDVFAPIRIGATTQTQHFSGTIDEVFVSTQNITKDALTALACISHPSMVAVNPVTSGPVPFDTRVHYDVAVTNNDIGACQPSRYNFFINFFDPTISTRADFPQFASAAPGATVHFGAEVTGSQDADPGVHEIPFIVDRFDPKSGFEKLAGDLTYELLRPACFVSRRQELMITSTSVVDDPVRTAGVANSIPFGDDGFFGDGGVAVVDASTPPKLTSGPAPVAGVWSFGQLMRDIAPTPEQAPAMVEQLLQTWLSDQTVNGFVVPARPAMQQLVLDIWPKTSSGALDLDQAPLRLQAIVSRLDLRNLSAQSAGEARFVFGVDDRGGFPQQFTVIVEYNLPAKSDADILAWANSWHGLSSHPFPSEEYNAALETITRSITQRNAAPERLNGTNLAQLRTNEIALTFGNRWEFRSFDLSPTTHFFEETTVDLTPDLGFNRTQTLADFVNENEATIIAETDSVPAQFKGSHFAAGSVFNDLIEWAAPGIRNDEARFHLSLNTCNGCHGPETNTFFLQINPRFPGGEAQLSPFLTGTTAFDQTTGQQRKLNELGRRKSDLTNLVCSPLGDGGLPPPPTVGPQSDGGLPPPPFDAGPPPPPFDAGPPTPFDAGSPGVMDASAGD